MSAPRRLRCVVKPPTGQHAQVAPFGMTVRCATTDPFVMLAPRVQNEATAPKEAAALTAMFATIARFVPSAANAEIALSVPVTVGMIAPLAMIVRHAMTVRPAMIAVRSFAVSARASTA